MEGAGQELLGVAGFGAAAELLGVQHVGQLGNAVLLHAGDRLGREADVVPVDSLGTEVRVAGDVDDATRRIGLGAGDDAIEEEIGQQEVAEMVDAEGHLEAVVGDASLAGHPGVVDEDVEGLVPFEEGGGRGPDRCQVGQVELEELGVAFADLVEDGLRLLF